MAPHSLLAAVLGGLAASLWTTSLLAQSCMPSPGPGNVCTANDLEISSIEFEGPGSCIDGEMISGELVVVIGQEGVVARAASERYDVGVFVGQRGEDSIGGAQCLFQALEPVAPPLDLESGDGPFLDLDGDACGDASPDPATTVRVPVTDLLCRDADRDGRLDFSATITWKNNRNEQCDDPGDRTYFFSEQSSRCRLEDEVDVPVLVVDPPEITVDKSAAPEQLPAPGGEVSFRVVVGNSTISPVRVTALEDDVYGNLDGRGSCALPVDLRPGDFYECLFTETVTGQAGDAFRDVVTAIAEDEVGNLATAEDDAIVTLVNTPAPAEMQVLKFAAPFTVDEPGEDVRYTVIVLNTGGAAFTLVDLEDDLYGDLDGKGNCDLPATLVPGRGLYGCSFSERVTGEPGDVVTDVITATALAQSGPLSDSDDASVRIRDVPSRLDVRKTASPHILPEPGGVVEFTVAVRNVSAVDTVVLDTLVDSVHGDLQGRGSCSVPQVLSPDQIYQCSFTADVTGPPGFVEFDSVDAAGTDDDGQRLDDADGAKVYIVNQTPELTVTKTPGKRAVTAPGDDVSFSVVVNNTSSVDSVVLETLVDDVAGDLDGQGDCSLPQPLAPGAAYRCAFIAFVSGQGGAVYRNTVTAGGTGDDGEAVSASASATVDIIGGSVITGPRMNVSKTPAPGRLPEPGGPVSFRVNVENLGAGGLELVGLVDDRFGDLDGLGNCVLPQFISPRDFYACAFEVPLSGAAGDVHRNTVTATAEGVDDSVLVETADATVFFEDVPASMNVSKTALPTRVREPGGTVQFGLQVRNSSAGDTLTLTRLVDDVHGDLDGRGSCSVPQTLEAGERYGCAFRAEVRGSQGQREVDTITVTALDSAGNTLSDADSATVNIIARRLGLSVDKRRDRVFVAAPGGDVTWTVTVSNDSPNDTLVLESLVDDRFGDLDGVGDCAVPQRLAVGERYTCAFTRFLPVTVIGVHLNRVTAVAVAEERIEDPLFDRIGRARDTVSAQDWAAVLLVTGVTPLPGTGVPIPADQPAALGLLVLLLGGLGLLVLLRR